MLTSKQRAILRKEAQALPVVFQVGKGEIDEALVKSTAECLAARGGHAGQKDGGGLRAGDRLEVRAVSAKEKRVEIRRAFEGLSNGKAAFVRRHVRPAP